MNDIPESKSTAELLKEGVALVDELCAQLADAKQRIAYLEEKVELNRQHSKEALIELGVDVTSGMWMLRDECRKVRERLAELDKECELRDAQLAERDREIERLCDTLKAIAEIARPQRGPSGGGGRVFPTSAILSIAEAALDQQEGAGG